MNEVDAARRSASRADSPTLLRFTVAAILAARRAAFGDDHISIGESMNNLAVLLYFRSRYAEAAELFEQILPRWRKERGDNHPDVLTLMNNLGAAQRQAGDYAGAEPILRETLALRRQRMLLGASLVANGKLVEAEPLITVSLPVLQAQWGNDHPSTRRAMNLHARLARTGLTR